MLADSSTTQPQSGQMSTDSSHASACGHTIVLGLGATGLSCARFLCAQGHSVVVMDTREAPPGAEKLRNSLPQVPLICGDFDPARLASASQIVISPGIAPDHPAVQQARADGKEVVGDIELFVRHLGARANAGLIAITGSNGKSTVTTLAGEMLSHAGLRAAVGGNLGPPALELLDEQAGTQAWVVELSSFQLQSTPSMRSVASVVLNLSADHLDRHGSMAAYAEAKRAVYQHTALAVVNRDDARASALAEGCPRVVSFGLDAPAHGHYGLVRDAQQLWLAHGGTLLMPVADVRMIGRHNLANALAALALCEPFEIDRAELVSVLRRFGGLPHRTEVVAHINQVAFVNDSKATNVGAAQAAINGIAQGKVVLIAGGQGKGADFAPMADALKSRARAAVLIGEDADLMAEAIAGACQIQRADSMAEAVARATALASPGDTVLLSPACASFDMFSGFAARGDAFRAAVEEMAS